MRPILFTLTLLVSSILASPLPRPTSPAFGGLIRRSDEPPVFPSNIPSCVACQPQWSSIQSCAAAAPEFQDASRIIWDPFLFVTLIKCACTDTFQSVYPQCVDCFVQTNQCATYMGGLNGTDAASKVVNGMRNVCGFGSAILGGVAKSQQSAGIQYTYTGNPHQPGSPTYTGVGGIDYGSGMGAHSAAARIFSNSVPVLASLVLATMTAIVMLSGL